MSCIAKNSGCVEFTGNHIVVIGCKLHSPTIESKIINHRFTIFKYRYSSMIACPCIVGGHFCKSDFRQIGITQQFFHFIGIRANNQQVLVFNDFSGNVHKALIYFVEHISPIGFGMWPCKLNKLLFSPFGR